MAGATLIERVRESDIWYSFRSSVLTQVAAAVALAMILAAALAPWISPQNPWDPGALRMRLVSVSSARR